MYVRAQLYLLACVNQFSLPVNTVVLYSIERTTYSDLYCINLWYKLVLYDSTSILFWKLVTSGLGRLWNRKCYDLQFFENTFYPISTKG